MEIVQPERKGGQLATVICLALWLLSAAAAIGAGPLWTALISAVGVAVGVLAIIQAKRGPSYAKPVTFPAILIGLHVAMLLLAAVLWAFFLAPLPRASLRMPRLDYLYTDPDGQFTLRGPRGWTYERVVAGQQSGVRLQPTDREAYMGLSEVTVLVRTIDRRPPAAMTFLEGIAECFGRSTDQPGRLFRFNTRPAELLSGERGVWSELQLKRFWIPLRQLAVYGIKNDRYLCSVSASGLTSHAILARAMCLGLFESLKPFPREETLKSRGNSG